MLAARYHVLLLALYCCLLGRLPMGRWLMGIAKLPGRWLEMARLGDEGVDIALAEAVSNLQVTRANGNLPMPDSLWARINRLHPARRLVMS